MEPTFGARLTSWLKFRKMSAATLARALVDGEKVTTRTAVNYWLHDKASPGTDRIIPICTALGVSVAEFFARMPFEDAALNAAREEQMAREAEVGPHPYAKDEITRELDAAAIDRALAGRKGEAA
jgi:transcriptional regulator with XRE-family HTH domain